MEDKITSDKIPFPFMFISRTLFRNGFIDLSNTTQRNRLVFLNYISLLTYAAPMPRNGKIYEAFEFSCSLTDIEKGCGFNREEARYMVKLFIKEGYLIRSLEILENNKSKFIWNIEKLNSKVIGLQASKESTKEKTPHLEYEKITVHNLSKPHTVLLEENHKKPHTKNDIENDEEKIKNPTLNQKTPHLTPHPTPHFLRVETPKNPTPNPTPNPHFLKNDKEAIESSLNNSDKEYKPRAREELSPSCKSKVIAPFNRSTYRLRNGKPLSPRMQNSLAKYSPTEMKRVEANVRHYEEFVDSGGVIHTTHEQYLQSCITNDLALKKENKGKNLLYAKFIKEEYKMNEMELNKTSMTIRKNSYETPDPIPLESNPKSFADVIDNYINAYYSGGIKCATN